MKNESSIQRPVLNNKILIVEDEPNVVNSIREALEKEPYKIVSADNGRVGLEIFEKENPVLIILDLRMPVMDGIEFLEHIKLSSSDPYSVIVLTGHGEDSDIKECFKLGISVFLRKPFNIYELRGLVKHSISSKQAEMQIKNLAKFPDEDPSPVLRISKDGTIIYANAASSSLLKLWNCRMNQHLPNPLRRLISNVFDSGSSQEIEAVCENDIFSLIITPVVDEDYINIYGHDVTKREQMEEEIHKLSTAVEQSPSVVMITDVNGSVEYVNPKFTKLTGYTIEETIGKNLYILRSGRQSNEVYKRSWSTITSGNEWHGELHSKKKSGEYYWEYVSISPIKNANNVITHFVKVAEDITNRKQAEEDLQRHHYQLEDVIDERTSELKKTYGQLLHAEKLAAVGRLSASIAHEFNNPVNGIRNVLELLGNKARLNKGNKKLADMAIRECDRMSNLIMKMRDFYRPSSGRKVPVDIHKTIDEVLVLCKKQFETRKIKLKKDYATDMPAIQAVADQIKQVVLNLLNNAEQAISGKGGKIKISTETFKKEIRVHIQDDGCGITPEDMKHIFEPFFSTKSVKGTGLGLSVSYGIIKEHGGDIKVSSQPSNGTDFTIILPINN
ncbi:MAG: ATP-binding response regulator [Candidatus Anammoxibacter sp.]